MNKVRAGSRRCSVSAMSAPSTLETKCARSSGDDKGRQRPRRHRRAEVRAADADIDDIGERVAPRAENRALAHGARESGDLGALRFHRRHHVPAVDTNRRAGKIAQGHVQGWAPLGGVDLLAGKQGFAPFFEPGGAGEVVQMAERGPGQAIFRIIIQQVVETDGKMIEPFRVFGEEIQGAMAGDLDAVGFQGGEGGVAIHDVNLRLRFSLSRTLYQFSEIATRRDL